MIYETPTQRMPLRLNGQTMKIRITSAEDKNTLPEVVPFLHHGQLMARHVASRFCVVTLYCDLVSSKYKSAYKEYANSPVCWKQRTGN
jgi:hypothetical protein